MEFFLKKLSDTRCEELNKLGIKDPERREQIDFRNTDNFTITNDDEYYILLKFYPRMEFISETWYLKQIFVMGTEYIFFEVHIEDGYEKCINGIKYQTRIIEIKKNETIQNIDKEVLGVLKDALVEANQAHFRASTSDTIKEIICTIKYDGEEL